MTRLQAFVLALAVMLAVTPGQVWPAPTAAAPLANNAPLNGGIQGFLERQGSGLATATFEDRLAADVIDSYTVYYGLDPRVLLTVMELGSGLVTSPSADPAALNRPISPAGPAGFERQVEWAVRELRAGLGPYTSPPIVLFADGTSRTLALGVDPSFLAVQRLLAVGRSEAAWQQLINRYQPLLAELFRNEAAAPAPTPVAVEPFLSDPWPAGTRVIHSSWFDHAYPMVDVHGDGNEMMVDYLGRGRLSYNSHDGHDFYFPDLPYGTPILAAAPGWAYARTTRGLGVVIRHGGAAAGYESVYWHLEAFASELEPTVDSDRPIWVERGQLLGWSGATGFTSGAPHLHFEMRHNGKQVDPFGWYGPGEDPCVRYPACARSTWLWEAASMWQRPDRVVADDQQPPEGLLTLNPPADLAFAAHLDGTALPSVGVGTTLAHGLRFGEGRFGQAAQVLAEARLAVPVSRTLDLAQGTVSFWTLVPERYPSSGTGRVYLLAASAHPADPAMVYSDTFALRHEAAAAGQPARWNFWTVDGAGQAHSLTATQTLAPGWHHMAVRWSAAEGAKSLLIDGREVAAATGVALPQQAGQHIELGRWYLDAGLSNAYFDDLAIWRHALPDVRVAALADGSAGLASSAAVVASPDLTLITQALDNGGGIAQVQLGMDGVFHDPLPYFTAYRWQLPATPGQHEVAVRYVDRAGNATTLTRTVELREPPAGSARIVASDDMLATVAVSATGAYGPYEVLLSSAPDVDGAWQPVQPLRVWLWPLDRPRQVYVRFRDGDGLVGPPLPLGPDLSRVFVPQTGH